MIGLLEGSPQSPLATVVITQYPLSIYFLNANDREFTVNLFVNYYLLSTMQFSVKFTDNLRIIFVRRRQNKVT